VATCPVTTDCRCACGSLLARLLHDAIELKCRRCKRVIVLTLSDRQWRPLAMP
jgi:phage FluMu protein Com